MCHCDRTIQMARPWTLRPPAPRTGPPSSLLDALQAFGGGAEDAKAVAGVGGGSVGRLRTENRATRLEAITTFATSRARGLPTSLHQHALSNGASGVADTDRPRPLKASPRSAGIPRITKSQQGAIPHTPANRREILSPPTYGHTTGPGGHGCPKSDANTLAHRPMAFSYPIAPAMKCDAGSNRLGQF